MEESKQTKDSKSLFSTLLGFSHKNQGNNTQNSILVKKDYQFNRQLGGIDKRALQSDFSWDINNVINQGDVSQSNVTQTTTTNTTYQNSSHSQVITGQTNQTTPTNNQQTNTTTGGNKTNSSTNSNSTGTNKTNGTNGSNNTNSTTGSNSTNSTNTTLVVTNFTVDYSKSGNTYICLVWPATPPGPATGGANVPVSYEIQYDQGYGVWIQLTITNKITYTVTGLTGGTTYQFQIRTVNIYGNAQNFSTPLSVFTAQVPESPNPPTLSIQNTFVQISWATPNYNYLPVDKYSILIQDSNGNFFANTQYCDGSKASIIQNNYCLIPMTVLRSSPFNLPFQAFIIAEVQAHNQRGWGALSQQSQNNPQIQTEPQQMQPVFRGAQSSTTQIVPTWTPVTSPQNGNSAVISYNLYWDSGSNGVNWQQLTGNPASLSTSYTITSVTQGRNYQFKVQAVNIYGNGPFSNITTIRAAMTPDQPVNVQTSIDTQSGGIKVAWIQPNANGDIIIKYMVEFKQANSNTWSTVLTNCDGSSSSVISNLSCIVPMSVFTNAPFNYQFQNLVNVRVSASNSIGYGPVSLVNTAGATIRVVPFTMTAPERGNLTTDNQIQVVWSIPDSPYNGDSPVNSFNLIWDNGTGITNISLIDQNVASFIIKGVTGGKTYKFKVRAYNIYGYGPFSPDSSIIPSDIPDQVQISSVNLTTNNMVTISWKQPLYHYQPILGYDIQILTNDGSFINDQVYCNGNSSTVMKNLNCSIPMLALIAETNLQADVLIQVKVRANNANGWGKYSELNVIGAFAQTLPAQIQNLAFDIDQSNTTQIVLNWEALTGAAKGGSNVTLLGYLVEWDQGSSVWQNMTLTNDTSAKKTGLVKGNTYQFRVKAINQFGAAFPSLPLAVLATQIPDTPNAPVISQSGTNITVSFSLPNSYNSPIVQVKLEFLTNITNQFAESPYCNGSEQSLMATLQCNLPMQSLRLAPFNLLPNTTVYARVSAKNMRGFSNVSQLNSVGPLIQGPPIQMSPPTRGPLTSIKQVEVNWQALSFPQNGGSSITTYIVYWDQGINAWIELIGETSLFTKTSYTIYTKIIAGLGYSFKVKAVNMWGVGDFSNVTTIVAGQVPDQMAALITTFDNYTGGISVSWTMPSPNGSPITSYYIQIKQKSGDWSSFAPGCDGSLSSVISSKSCIISMVNLTQSPFNLLRGDLVQVRASAINSAGNSTPSNQNQNGPSVKTVPDTMTQPFRGAGTSSYQIEVNWTPLTGTSSGNSPILSYDLWWDNGNGQNNIQLINANITSYVVSSLTLGNNYTFIVRAKNIYGYGSFSPPVTISALSVPNTLSQVTTTLKGSNVQISWNAPSDTSTVVKYYQIQLFNPNLLQNQDDTADCDGQSSLVISQLSCSIPTSTLMAQFGYRYGDTVRATVRVMNQNGWSNYSPLNNQGAVITGPPQSIYPPYSGPLTSGQIIDVNWPILSSGYDTGGSPIISYNLDMYSNLTNSWQEVVGLTTVYNFTQTSVTGVISGKIYSFRLRAQNALGWGQYSSTIQIVPSGVPSQMDVVNTTLVGTNVVVNWTAPADSNGSPIKAYQIYFTQSDGTLTLIPLFCDGTNSTIIAAMKCSVPMAILRAPPLNLIGGQLIVVVAIAVNDRGQSLQSSPNTDGVRVVTEPFLMSAPLNGASTTETQIQVLWSPLPSDSNGGSPIISYNLQWDAGTNGVTWTNLLGLTNPSLMTQLLITTNISPKTNYQFKVRAQNVFGWGQFSPSTTIITATTPRQMLAPVTYIDTASGGVGIRWSAPAAGSNPIDAYKIEIADALVQNWYTVTSCDGSQTTIFTNRYCVIPMLTLISSPLSLVFDQIVIVRASAHSSVGWGSVSPSNSIGAKIQTVPQAVANLTVASHSETSISLSWTALTSPLNGNSDILGYNIQWDNGLGNAPSIDLVNTTSTTYSQTTQIVAGRTYQFKVRARNVYGYGPFSSVVPTSSYSVPDKMSAPTVGKDPANSTNIKVSWQKPNSYSSTINQYDLQFLASSGSFVSIQQCDTSSTLALQALYCIVAMKTVKDQTGLSIDSIIKVKVRASNLGGWGDYSNLNTMGASIEGVPDPSPLQSTQSPSTTYDTVDAIQASTDSSQSKYMLIVYIGVPVLVVAIGIAALAIYLTRKPPTIALSSAAITNKAIQIQKQASQNDQEINKTMQANNSQFNDNSQFFETMNPYSSMNKAGDVTATNQQLFSARNTPDKFASIFESPFGRIQELGMTQTKLTEDIFVDPNELNKNF